MGNSERAKKIVQTIWSERQGISFNTDERTLLEELVTMYLDMNKFQGVMMRNKSEVKRYQRLVDKKILYVWNWAKDWSLRFTDVSEQEIQNVVENEGMARGGEVLLNYQKELEAMSDEKLKEEYENEFGVDGDNRIEDERDEVIEELVSHYKRVLKSRGEMAKGGIANQYEGKNHIWMWNNWSPDQRRHFMEDHVIVKKDLPDKNFFEIDDEWKKILSPKLKKHFDSGQYAIGGGVKVENKGVDLFEDYENIPCKVQKILDKYEEGFMDGDYDILGKAKSELEDIGYTFEYYLDGQAYDLRKIGQVGKVEYAQKHGIGLMKSGGILNAENYSSEIKKPIGKRFVYNGKEYKIIDYSSGFGSPSLSIVDSDGNEFLREERAYDGRVIRKNHTVTSLKSLLNFSYGGSMASGGEISFKKPNIKMSDSLFQDLAQSSLKIIDKAGRDKIYEEYKEKPVRTMWEVYHQVSFQKNNKDTHPSFQKDPNRRVIEYDENFRSKTDELNDSHIQSAMKSIFAQIYSGKSAVMALGGWAGKETSGISWIITGTYI